MTSLQKLFGFDRKPKKPKMKKMPKMPKQSSSLEVHARWLDKVEAVKKENTAKLKNYNEALKLHEQNKAHKSKIRQARVKA